MQDLVEDVRMDYAMALVMGETRTLMSHEYDDAKIWLARFDAWLRSDPPPVGLELRMPAVSLQVAVEHAASDGATLCGIGAARCEVMRTPFRPDSPRVCRECRRVATDSPNPWPTSVPVRRDIPMEDMSEREFFAEVSKRPGLFVGSVTWERVATWITGYDTHAWRYGGEGLDGFREWLLARPGANGSNLVWSGIVLRSAFPDRGASASTGLFANHLLSRRPTVMGQLPLRRGQQA